MELTPRKEKILVEVVREFLETGEPVGSKAIAEQIGVSSATIRNEMADLIEFGLLQQPHTSAGRIPTQQGYREYVNRLQVPELSDREKRAIVTELLASGYEPERILQRMSQVLAQASRCAAVVSTPNGAAAKIKAVQFVQTSRRTAMLLMMSSAGTLKSRIFRCDFDLTGDMMRIFFRLFNERVAGVSVSDITPAFLQSAAVSFGDMYALAASPLAALLETAQDTSHTDFYVSGQMNLLFCPQLPHRQVLDLLESRQELTDLLGGRPGKVVARIGSENGQAALREASVLVGRYRVGPQDAGSLAIIGPMNMDYLRLTALLQYLTTEVGDLLTALLQEE